MIATFESGIAEVVQSEASAGLLTMPEHSAAARSWHRGTAREIVIGNIVAKIIQYLESHPAGWADQADEQRRHRKQNIHAVGQ